MAKKTFKDTVRAKAADNTALQFFSNAPITAEEPEEPETFQQSGETVKRSTSARRETPEREAKTRRVQLLLTPSLYDAIRNKAEEERRSVNDMVNLILEDAIRQ